MCLEELIFNHLVIVFNILSSKYFILFKLIFVFREYKNCYFLIVNIK